MSHQTFAHTHRVTYAECTMGNHVYYGRYLELLEETRGEFFRNIGLPFKQLQENDTLLPVVEARLRYKGAARYDQVLRIEVWLRAMERVRLEFFYRIVNDAEKLILEASTMHACTTADDRLKRLPDELVTKLQPYVASAIEK